MKKYKGFSLIEVLMLFAALTVILAVTAPLVTKRAKDVPTKLPHGFYQCYRDDSGNLHEEWYNSFRRISSDTVSECKFTPPENVTLFKITLIGAGTGGVSLASVTHSTEIFNATYSTNGTYSGIYLVPLDLDMLNTIFATESVRVCSDAAPVGGTGQTEQRYYFNAGSIYCEGGTPITQPKKSEYIGTLEEGDEGYDEALAKYNADLDYYTDAKNALSSLQAKLKYNSYDGDSYLSEYQTACQDMGYSDAVINVYSKSQQYNDYETGSGGTGGSRTGSLYAHYDYSINGAGSLDFNGYKDYLKAVYNSYNDTEKMSCSSGWANYCNQSDTTTVKDGYSPAIYKTGNIQSGTPEDATDAQGGRAVVWTEPVSGTKYTRTTFSSATRGTNGEVSGDGYYDPYSGNSGSAGTNSGGGSLLDTCTNHIPNGVMTTTRLVKYITLGSYGNTGNVETYTVRDLGTKQCKIYIGKGSLPHAYGTRNTKDVQPYVNTVLSCAGVELTAQGGLESDAYVSFSYMPDDDENGTTSHTPDDADKPAAPTYKYPNLWLKHIAKPSYTFGSAGDGTTLTDNCTNKYGTMTYGSDGNTNKGGPISVGRACEETDYTGTGGGNTVTAGSGGHGAIFIRW